MARTVSTAGLFFALALTCLLASFLNSAKARLDYPPALELADGGEVSPPAGLRESLVAILAAEPLDQASLNLLYALEARSGIEPARRAAMVEALGDLGWRSSQAQRNVMVEAIRRNDAKEALHRVDALLRRDKLREEIFPLLYVLEQDPGVTDILVGRLAKQPNWRTEYFAGAAHLADPRARAARTALLGRMIREGQRPSRDELKPSLDAFVAAGEPARAFALLKQLGYRNGKGVLNRDPSFVVAAELSAEGAWMALPSEWEMSARNGVTVRTMSDGAGHVLAIRWDGAGAPWLLRQQIFLAGQRLPAVEVLADSDRDWRELRRLGFQWQCPGEQPVRLVVAAGDQMNNRLVLALPAPAACDYGALTVSGLPQSLDQPVQARLKSIRVLAGGAPAVARPIDGVSSPAGILAPL